VTRSGSLAEFLFEILSGVLWARFELLGFVLRATEYVITDAPNGRSVQLR
jgi:hypothetical protein